MVTPKWTAPGPGVVPVLTRVRCREFVFVLPAPAMASMAVAELTPDLKVLWLGVLLN